MATSGWHADGAVDAFLIAALFDASRGCDAVSCTLLLLDETFNVAMAFVSPQFKPTEKTPSFIMAKLSSNQLPVSAAVLGGSVEGSSNETQADRR